MKKNLVATHEVMFYMGGNYGRRRVCDVRSNETDVSKRGKEMVFHQVFASSLTAKETIDFLNNGKLKFITPTE